jgi:hypothetical protein
MTDCAAATGHRDGLLTFGSWDFQDIDAISGIRDLRAAGCMLLPKDFVPCSGKSSALSIF